MSEGNDLVRKMWFFVVEDIKRIVVGISEDYLYCENLKKRIGDCSIGDNSVLSLSEQKLIRNIIYRLTQTPAKRDDNNNEDND